MTSHENIRPFRSSPEAFSFGREVVSRFSLDNTPDFEPDYDLGRKRLMDTIKDEPKEQTVFQSGTSDLDGEKQDKGPWEPLLRIPSRDNIFLDFYNGPFSDVLDLNRQNIERLISVADIRGKISFRNATVESSDRYDLTAHDAGWIIDFDGDRTEEMITASAGNKNSREHRFASEANKVLKKAMTRAILREKLTSEIYGGWLLATKAYFTSMPFFYLAGFHGLAQQPVNEKSLFLDAVAVPFIYGFENLVYAKVDKDFNDRLILPPLEVDRVIRSLIFLQTKGRNLIRLRPECEELG